MTTNTAPTVAYAMTPQIAVEDAIFHFVVPGYTFADADEDDHLTFRATLANGDALPSWLSFDATTQAFSGTPLNGDVGSLNIKVTATDVAGAAVSNTFFLGVLNTNDAPTALPIANQAATQDVVFGYTLPTGTFSDVDVGDHLTYSATLDNGAALPNWLHFDATTQTFRGTPTSANVGHLLIKVSVTDMGNTPPPPVLADSVGPSPAVPIIAHTPVSSSFTLTVVAPTITAPVLAAPHVLGLVNDPGIPGDNITNDAWNAFHLGLDIHPAAGQIAAVAGDQIEVYADAHIVGRTTLTQQNIDSGQVNVNNSWGLHAGASEITAKIIRYPAVFTSSDSSPLTITVDNIAPTLVHATQDGQLNVALNASLTLDFSETMLLGHSGQIRLMSDNGQYFQAINLANPNGQLSVSGNRLTITPTLALHDNTHYHVDMSIGAVTDSAGNAFAGFYDPTVLDFKTVLTPVVIATPAPAAPLTKPLGITLASDTGVAGDHITNNAWTAFQVSLDTHPAAGQVGPTVGDTIQVYAGTSHVGTTQLSQQNLDTGTVNVNNSWGLHDGTSSLTAKVISHVNAQSATSDAVSVTVDHSAPRALATQSDEGATINANGLVHLQFDEAIKLGSTGVIKFIPDVGVAITLNMSTQGTQVHVDALNNHQIDIDPLISFIAGTHYHVEIDNSAILDVAGNAFVGNLNHDADHHVLGFHAAA